MKRFRTDSMFYRLFGSFLMIIVLLTLFIGVAFTFFVKTIRGEITKNSSLNLDSAVSNYEEHFEQIRSLGLSLQFNEQIALLSRRMTFPVEAAAGVRNHLQASISNPYLYLDNMIIYMKNNNYAIEKDSSANADLLFGKLLYSEDYPLSFWEEEMKKDSSFAIYPASYFWENSLGTPVRKGSYIPILIKKVNDDKTAVLALMDSARTFGDFFDAKPGNPFAILDPLGKTLFLSSETPLPDTLTAAGSIRDTGYLLQDNQYYFYQKGRHTGFTYVSVIPYKHVNQQLLQLNVFLGLLLTLSVLISIAVSAWISRKLNAPVRHLAEWIGSVQPGPPKSNIRELQMISDRIIHIKEDINHKNSVLNQYAYADLLKMLEPLSGEFHPPAEPFIMLLFQLTPENEAQQPDGKSGLQQLTALLRETIGSQLSTRFRHTITLQLEQREILTVLHFGEGEEPELGGVTAELMELFDKESGGAFMLTLGISPSYRSAENFSRAYAHVSALVKQRRLGTGAQLITRLQEPPSQLAFSHQEEQEFYINLTEGNEEIVLPMIRRVLARHERKQGYACQYRDWANEVVNRVMKTMYTHNIDPDKLTGILSPYDEIKSCHTYDAYVSTLEALVQRACRLVKDKKAATDPITSFVMSYIEEHYAEDISLDMLADRLHITPGYLSTYFKEKNGINFVDYMITFRMNKAKEILSRTDLKIQEVAQLVGYSNVSTFIRVFKKQTGTTPGDFKKLKTG